MQFCVIIAGASPLALCPQKPSPAQADRLGCIVLFCSRDGTSRPRAGHQTHRHAERARCHGTLAVRRGFHRGAGERPCQASALCFFVPEKSLIWGHSREPPILGGTRFIYVSCLEAWTIRSVPEPDLGSRKRRPPVKAAGSPKLLLWGVFCLRTTDTVHYETQIPFMPSSPASRSFHGW